MSADPLGLTPEQRAMSNAAELIQGMPEHYRRNIEQIKNLPAGTIINLGGVPTPRETLLARLGEDADVA